MNEADKRREEMRALVKKVGRSRLAPMRAWVASYRAVTAANVALFEYRGIGIDAETEDKVRVLIFRAMLHRYLAQDDNAPDKRYVK